MEICPDGADVDELRADSRSSPCDILRSLPLDCFELGWRAMEYTHQRDDRIRILKSLGKGFSISYVNWDRRQEVVFWQRLFQFGVYIIRVSG